MKLSQFKFDLPEKLIATRPASIYHEIVGSDGEKQTFRTTRRDECRMMVVHRRTKTIDLFHEGKKGKEESDFLQFRDIINYFGEGDTFVMNDTRVFPARLYGTKEKTDAEIEVFLLRELNSEMRLWDVLVEPARKIRIGNKLFFDPSGAMVAEVIDNTTSRGRTLRFLYDCSHEEFKHDLFAHGEMPVPHNILDLRGEIHSDADDVDDFQCLYARNEGAVTAPTTGLHFSRELLKRFEIKGIDTQFITLHCSLGIFHKIEVEDLTKHKVESERVIVPEATCDKANAAKLAGHHVVIVGASVAKATETSAGTDGLLKPYDGWTNKFIFPPYEYGFADSMVVNFYRPMSTMMMATAAFGGYELVMKAYELAVEHGYKFGCFGDAMLILND